MINQYPKRSNLVCFNPPLNSDWSILQLGNSLDNLQIIKIHYTLDQKVPLRDYEYNLKKIAEIISKSLQYNLELGSWQVIFIKGVHAKKFACSGRYYVVFQKKDGLLVYIWLNRFVNKY